MPRWYTPSRWSGLWLGLALVAASCANAPKARADVREDVDRALRDTSPPEKSAAHGGERHEGSQVGDRHGSGGAKAKSAEKSAAKEESRRSPEARDQRQVAELRRQLRELQRKVDRFASREEAKGGQDSSMRQGRRGGESGGDRQLRKAAANLCSTLGEETAAGNGKRRASEPHAPSASAESAQSGGGPSASDGTPGREKQLDAIARQLDAAEHDVQHIEQRTGKGAGGSASGRSQPSSGSESGGSASRKGEWQGRRSGGDRVERSAMKAATVSGEVAAVDRQQLVVRSDGGNLVLISLGSDTVIHSHDEQLDPGALVRGTPVRVQYRPAGRGELHAVDVALRDTD